MRPSVLACAAALAVGVSGSASAHERIRYHFVIVPDTIPIGGSASVTLLATIDPGVGSATTWTTAPGTGQAATVAGFGTWVGRMRATPDAGLTGGWSSLAVNPLNVGLPPAGTNSPGAINGPLILGIRCGQNAPPAAGFNSSNTIELWQGTWTHTGTATGQVAVRNYIDAGSHILLDVPGVGHVVQTGGTTVAKGVITVVPAPAGAAVLGLAGILAARRRRGSGP